MHPPHLPPKESDASNKSKDFYIHIFFTILVSFFSGISAAMVAFTWILPPFPSLRTNFTFFQNSQNRDNDFVLSQDQKSQMKERMIQVFDTRKKFSEDFFSGAAFLGSAPLLTLDGWAVLTAPITQSDMKFLEVFDSQGRVLSVEQVIPDTKTGLVYINVQGQGFPVFALANSVFTVQEPMWFATQDDFIFSPLFVSFPQSKENSGPLVDSIFKVQGNDFVSSFIVNEKAELTGVVNKNSVIFPSTDVIRHLRFLQKNDTIKTSFFPASGYIVYGVQKDESGKASSQYGFFVTDVGTKIQTGLLLNDIITHVQGNSFNPQTVREDILNAGDEMIFTVVRQEKSIEVKVKKVLN